MSRIITQLAYALLAIGLLTVNIFLQRQNHELSSRIANLEAGEGPLVGSSFSQITGTDLNDAIVTLDFSRQSGRSLFLVVSRSCTYCGRNWKYWLRLLESHPKAEVVVADVAGDVSASYFREVGSRVPERVLKLNGLTRVEYGLRITPTTIVLGPNGRVLGVWLGVLNDKRVVAIQRLLDGQDDRQ